MRHVNINITGPAASGKTVLMGEIARHLQSIGLDVQCCEDVDCDGESSEVAWADPPRNWEAGSVLITASQELPEPRKVVARGDVPRVAVPHCPRCSHAHYGIQVNEYTHSSPPWTHWFICPELNEPVSLYVVTDGSGAGLEIDRQIVEQMFDAQAAGQWMSAIFYVKSGRLLMHRRTAGFPRGDLAAAVDMLRDNLQEEIGPPPLMELPPATKDGEELEPVFRLFE